MVLAEAHVLGGVETHVFFFFFFGGGGVAGIKGTERHPQPLAPSHENGIGPIGSSCAAREHKITIVLLIDLMAWFPVKCSLFFLLRMP